MPLTNPQMRTPTLGGARILSPQFRSLGSFRNGLATFRVNDRVGVLDRTGKVISPADFDSIEVLADGLSFVEDKQKGLGYTGRHVTFVWGPTSQEALTDKVDS